MTDEMKAAAKQERSAYFKTWRAQNKDKITVYQERYWLNRALSTLQTVEA